MTTTAQRSRCVGLMVRGASTRPILAGIFFAFIFFSISLGVIVAGRGIPAVFDGNETFSSILHARNLLTFGPERSAALADESTSPWPQGHPVVHTHQGNFPRIYATILYALGLSDPMSQVLATVLPVGCVSVLLFFVALHRVAGFGVAAAACVFLLTDYILFLQWQMVTYRIWHFAFTATLLASAVFYRSGGRVWLLVAAFITSAFLFYYELVFATFLSVSISLFTLLLWRRNIIKGIAFVGAQLAGMVLGVSILIAQLVIYLGWDGFVADVKLTYLSRNVSAPEQLAVLRAFVEQHHIASFYNFADPISHDLKRLLLQSVFRWGLQVYTPPFAYCILILAAGVAVALFARPGDVRWPRTSIATIAIMAVLAWLVGASAAVLLTIIMAASVLIFVVRDARIRTQSVDSLDAVVLFGVPVLLYVLMAVGFSHFLGYERDTGPFWQSAAAIGTAIAMLFTVLFFRVVPKRPGRLTLDVVLRGSALVCVGIALARFHAHLYDPSLTPLWQSKLPGSFVPASLQAAGMVLATVCAAALAAFGPDLPDRVRMGLRVTACSVAMLIGCFAAGLLVVAILSPGYVYSGYMVRYLNLLAVPLALAIGALVYSAAVVGRYLIVELWPESHSRWTVATQLHLVPLALFAAWWIAIQAANAHAYPPHQLAVVKPLQSLARNHPTIVSNSYPAPFSIATGQWAYLDETFSAGKTTFSPASGYRYVFDKKYLWVADRDNPKYERPDLFVCYIPPTYWSEAIRLADAHVGLRCSDNRVVQFAEEPEKRLWPRPTLIARDPSVRDTWAIVRLDWDFPPYIGAEPVVTGTAVEGWASLNVSYDYRQQDGRPEQVTEIEIWTISHVGKTCTLHGAALTAAKAVGGSVLLRMALPNSGREFIAVARPQTKTRSGAPFFSPPFRVEEGTIVAVDPSCDAIVDANKKVWPRTEGG